MDAAPGRFGRRSAAAAAEAAAKRARAQALASYLCLGDAAVAYPLAATLVAALLWPDGTTCRKVLGCCHRLVDVAGGEARYEPLLGSHLFHAALHLLLRPPAWLAGLEWDVLNLARDLYCLFGLGISAERLTYAVASAHGAAVAAGVAGGGAGFGGGGGGANGSSNGIGGDAAAAAVAAGTPTPFQPGASLGGHALAAVAARPRAILLSVGGVTPHAVALLEHTLARVTDSKSQKDAFREVLRGAQEWLEAMGAAGGGGLPAQAGPAILDLPRMFAVGPVGRPGGLPSEEALVGLAFLFDSGRPS
jgi:hypothetical protein